MPAPASPDVLRAMIREFAQRMMDADACRKAARPEVGQNETTEAR
jgi:hypothetical protein